MKKYVYIIVLISSSLFLSCSAMGTNSNIHNPQKMRGIKKIGIAPYDLNIANIISVGEVCSILDNRLLKDLNNSYFTITPRESFLKYAKQSMTTNKRSILKNSRSMDIDAVLFCTLTLIPRNASGMQWTDAGVHLEIFDTETDELIAESDHNTISGNSYWMPPKLSQAIYDAIEGSSTRLLKRIESIHN